MSRLIFAHMIFTNSDGQILAEPPSISFLDHGFLFGDSIYEVVRLYDGKLFGWEEHRSRLLKSAARVGIPVEALISQIEERLHHAFKRLGKKNAVTRIIITRGVGKLHIDYRSCNEPRVYMASWEFDSHQVPDSVRVMLPKIKRNHKETMDPGIKSGNYLNNVMALREAIDSGFDDALLLNPNLEVTELTTSNIGWIKEGKLKTPSMDSGILYGITRHFFLKFFEVEEAIYSEDDLKSADEIFALSTLKEVCPVSEIQFSDGSRKSYAASAQLKSIQKSFHERIVSEIAKSPAIL